jgi:hypothetical protein
MPLCFIFVLELSFFSLRLYPLTVRTIWVKWHLEPSKKKKNQRSKKLCNTRDQVAKLFTRRTFLTSACKTWTFRLHLWDVAIYICKDNHLSNCSIIITIAQYTQMYLNNRTALARAASEYWLVELLVTNWLRRYFCSAYKPPIVRAYCFLLRHCLLALPWIQAAGAWRHQLSAERSVYTAVLCW